MTPSRPLRTIVPATNDPTVYRPVYGQPNVDTIARRERTFTAWTGRHGPCVVRGCDERALDGAGRCGEHAD